MLIWPTYPNLGIDERRRVDGHEAVFIVAGINSTTTAQFRVDFLPSRTSRLNSIDVVCGFCGATTPGTKRRDRRDRIGRSWPSYFKSLEVPERRLNVVVAAFR